MKPPKRTSDIHWHPSYLNLHLHSHNALMLLTELINRVDKPI